MDPEHFEARFSLAKLLAMDAPAEAAVHLEILLKRSPENVEVRFRQAANCRALGQFAEAQEALDALLGNEPNNVEFLLERGQLALDLRQPVEAERFLLRALAQAPHEARTHLAMANCLRMAGKAGEAKQYEDSFQQIDRQRRERHEKLKKKDAVSSGGH
jgi:predicted Zn-dependent protease